uniref:Neuropeptide FF receptor 1 n=1 Tax=Gouania willdenowi TaxID=441366 RepID=A0A8C5HCE6_GOUWI
VSFSPEAMELEGFSISVSLSNNSLDGTTNVTNITLSHYYPHSVYMAAGYIVAYSFIFLLCMVGNILVCLIVLENHRMRTVTNLFIFNLAISDLLVGIFCIPTTLVDNLITGWPFSNTICKMSGFVQGVSVSASVFTLVAIAIERFRCIVYPLRPKLTLLVAKAAIASIWILAVIIMCPSAVALTVERIPFHYMVYNDDLNNTIPLYACYENFIRPQMRKVYTAILFAFIYLIPLVVIMVMYGSIGVKLFTSVVASREPQLGNGMEETGGRRRARISQKKIRVVKMLIVVALLFMLSWLPLWTLWMIADYASLDNKQLDFLAGYIFPFAHWLAFSNSSVNPIIYGYYNENFKRGFQAVCKSRSFSCVVQLGSKVARCGRKRRSRQAHSGNATFRDALNNHNHFGVGVRNRIHNDNLLTDKEDVNKTSKVMHITNPSSSPLLEQGIEMIAVHQKVQSSMSDSCPPAVMVHQAWDSRILPPRD